MKNKIFFLIVLLCAGVSVACQDKGREVVEAGVSRELALRRKAEIKNLRYHLHFALPAEKSRPVEGKVKILFSLETATDILLDFRENPEYIGEIRLNGNQVEVQVVNEHILLPGVQGENVAEIVFRAGDQSLNRNEEYLYTLLVPDRARTLFPCFDQPDLKAPFSLSLEIPEDWVAVANGPVEEERIEKGRKKINFAQTKPLSTYLFSFVAGKWTPLEKTCDGRKVTLYHRETDSLRLAQTDVIFAQVFEALKWMEDYTGIAYPFEKYDLVIVPGFQFGGMEHPGAVLYNDKRIFLNEHPTLKEELGRMELISHETAHMWFGDAVTMEWFNDVWTKEVFANYFAARMCEPRFPEVNHRLNTLSSFYPAAYSEDRTLGTNAIRQELGNLNSAGLIYGQIVYHKAPVVMTKLVELMGEENFRKGIQEYLQMYAYGNATWDGLIGILNKHTATDLIPWSKIWVDEKGMPEIRAYWQDGKLTVKQYDPWKRGYVWPQKLTYTLLPEAAGKPELSVMVEFSPEDSVKSVEVAEPIGVILPNTDGRGYGCFVLDDISARYCLQQVEKCEDPVTRLSLILTLYENQSRGRVAPGDFVRTALRVAESETEPLLVSMIIGQVKNVYMRKLLKQQPEVELALQQLCWKFGDMKHRQLVFRALLEIWTLPEISEEIYRIWKMQQLFQGFPLGETDYMKMAYELAIRYPERYQEIVEKQTEMIANPDRKKEFRFVARSVHPDAQVRDSLFQALMKPENRRIEPWTAQVIYYLNHPLRQPASVKYILPALEELQEIQRTGDIFFPKNWIEATLKGHNSPEAAKVVKFFLEKHPDYPPLLKNKILQSADHLICH